MAKTLAKLGKGEGSRIIRYFKETRAEIGRVTWPTREQATRLTLIVLAVTAALAAVLALIDYVFAWMMSRVLAFDVIVISVLLVLLVGGGAWWAVVGRRRA
ncbi:MAG: preprotein translocase subunit SecE [Anaerolineae bacterium]